MRNPFRRKNRARSEVKPVVLVASLLMALPVLFIAAVVYLDPSEVHEVRAGVRRMVAEVAQNATRMAGAVSNYLLDQPYFAVQEIKVFGADAADGAEIIARAGLRRGLSIWRIDAQGLEEKIRRHPWIKRVVVRKELPRRVIVDVEEWRPAGIVALESLYYVDADGVVFKAVAETDSVDFPLVTGLRAASLSPHEPSTRGKLSQVLGLGREVEEAGVRLSEIRFSAEGNIVLYPAADRVPFAMGWGNWAEKVLRLKRFLRVWDGQEAHFAGVDMRFEGQAVARLRRSL